eukprot:2781234-Rhodomonas_salina.1
MRSTSAEAASLSTRKRSDLLRMHQALGMEEKSFQHSHVTSIAVQNVHVTFQLVVGTGSRSRDMTNTNEITHYYPGTWVLEESIPEESSTIQ